MTDADIAAAARRVAEDGPVTPQRAASYMAELTRMFADMVEGGDTIPIRKDALVALLPVFDAVGVEPGEDRVERWRDAMYDISSLPTFDEQARAAIALADAERAAG